MWDSWNWQEMASAFVMLFAVIDIIGNMPVIVSLKEKGKSVEAGKVALSAFALMLGFFYAGDMILRLFHVDIASFAVAGAFVLFFVALEMLLDVEIFKGQDHHHTTLVPVVFPLLAGAGSFTALLSLRAEYADINIVAALILNMVLVYAAIRGTGLISRIMGKTGIYMSRKFFGIIVLAIAVKLFASNITQLLGR
ncbi:MarC family protein [Akkermansia glycaniphila]|uniref:UPF0056 membrane protein n=1 Tax=Akkermansia glycaniphila TaxID=1679444 RepID=A0A1C7PEN5_9BACT|nr:MarC family protein [Akkermansia glycaniphila]OCA03874.1 hypothetical protein AC781_00935 [Akkermansia glycaniphila]SEH69691.1 marc family integral membrane protein [Akkermansia glycaniphila]